VTTALVEQIVLSHSTVQQLLVGATLAFAMFLLDCVTAHHRYGLAKPVKLEYARDTTSKQRHQIAISTAFATIPRQNITLVLARLDGLVMTAQSFYVPDKIALGTDNATQKLPRQSAHARWILLEMIAPLTLAAKAKQSFKREQQLELL